MTPNYLTVLQLDDLADQAERFLLMSYERLPRTYVLHNDSWGITLSNHAREIALRRAGASPDLAPLCRTVALLEACRHWGATAQIRPMMEVVREFREWTGPDYLNLQLTLNGSLNNGGALQQEITDVLYDAQLAQRLMSGTEGAELSWLEERYRTDAEAPMRLSYLKAYLMEVREARFRNGNLRRQYQHTHSAILLELQQLIDTLEQQQIRRAKPKKPVNSPAIQTYFRTVFRNHIQLYAIADRKAAIMISINAILIGANVTFVSYRNWAQTRPEILLPVSVFVVCALVSITYAILSSRPRQRREGDGEDLAFFTTFSKLSYEEFAEATGQLLSNGDKLYATLTRSLHEIGTTLDRRFSLLRTSYTIFLGGLVASTLLFLIVLGLL